MRINGARDKMKSKNNMRIGFEIGCSCREDVICANTEDEKIIIKKNDNVVNIFFN